MFKKGQSGNPAGKKPGTQNKITRETKRVIGQLLDCATPEDIKEIYDDCKKKMPQVLIKFFAQIAPKQIDIDMNVGENKVLDALKQVEGVDVEDSNSDNDSTDDGK